MIRPSLNDRLFAGIFGIAPEDAAEAAKNKADHGYSTLSATDVENTSVFD